MTLIDIDRIHYIDSHVYYIKEFEACAAVMDKKFQFRRIFFNFAIEYKPLGDINIIIKTDNSELNAIKDKLCKKIRIMDQEGRFVNEN